MNNRECALAAASRFLGIDLSADENEDYTEEDRAEAWDQLQRVHDYLQSRTDLAYLDLYHNGESARLYEAWQLAGDAMWLVRDALKGRFPLVGRREITSVEVLFDREGGSL